MSKFLEILGMAARKASDVTPATFTTPGATAAPVPPGGELTDEEVSQLVKSLVAPVLVGGRRYEAAPEMPVPDATLIALLRGGGPELDATKRAEAVTLADEWQAGIDALNAAGRDRIADAFAKHQAEVAEAAIAGKPVENSWTKAEIESDFASRRASIKGACAARSEAAAKIFAGIAADSVAFLRSRAEGEAVSEFRRFASFGVDYTPSQLVRTLLAAGARLGRLSEQLLARKGGLGTNPRSMFAAIGIEL